MRRHFFTLYLWLIGSIMLSLVTSYVITILTIGDTENQLFHNQIAAYRNLAIDTADGDQALQMEHMEQLAKTMGAAISPAHDSELTADETQLVNQQGLLVIDSVYAHCYFSLPGDKKIYRFQYQDNNPLLELGALTAHIFLLALLLPPALVVGIWLYLLRRKLEALENAANTISSGNLSARAPTDKHRQVGDLNNSFNLMAQRIQHLILSHKQLTNAVAHELRSPIFRLQCQLDMLIENEDQQEKSQLIEGIDGDIQELSELVEEMLQYARMESAELTVNITQQNISEWLHKLVSHVQLESSVPITYMPPSDPLRAAYDPHLLQRAILNLIRNAARYAQSAIHVNVQRSDHAIQITVDDDGPGIPQEQREEVLKPFYRLDTARDRTNGGHGLGLAIVQQIVKMHEGGITVEESPLSGARFVLTLPQAQTSI